MTTVKQPPAAVPHARGAVVAMSVGLALTVLATLVAVVGQADAGLLSDHLRAAYPPALADAAARSAPGLEAYLVGVGVAGVVSWLVAIRAVARGRRWARGAATAIFVLATGLALFDLLVGEYGATLLPGLLGVTGVLPCLAGLVAVVRLWTGGDLAGAARRP